MIRSLPLIVAWFLVAGTFAAPKPIVKLGTADLSMVETTPVLWKGKILRFESVRANYNGFTPRDVCMGNDDYYRFRDVSSQEITPSFGRGHWFGSALVQRAVDSANEVDTMWVFGTDTHNQTYISAFKSTDLITWSKTTAIQLPSNYVAFNNAATKDGDDSSFTMAIEIGKPADIVGAGFTSVFARSTDLESGFTLLDPAVHVYTKAEYSACPTIRKFGAYFYVATLFSSRNGYQEMLVRSKDLINWEGPHGTSNGTAYNPILAHGDNKLDRAINQNSWNYNTNFSEAMKSLISNATDINNSDIDFCDDGRGGVYISYSWGNQEGIEFLAAAMVESTTEQEWLESYFS